MKEKTQKDNEKRDEVLKCMLNTKPQPKKKPSAKKPRASNTTTS
jgi:hypothetical protein